MEIMSIKQISTETLYLRTIILSEEIAQMNYMASSVTMFLMVKQETMCFTEGMA